MEATAQSPATPRWLRTSLPTKFSDTRLSSNGPGCTISSLILPSLSSASICSTCQLLNKNGVPLRRSYTTALMVPAEPDLCATLSPGTTMSCRALRPGFCAMASVTSCQLARKRRSITSLGTTLPPIAKLGGISREPSPSSLSGAALRSTVNWMHSAPPGVLLLILWPIPTELMFFAAR